MWLNHNTDLVDVHLTAGGTSTAAAMGTMSATRVVHTSGHGVLIGDDLNSAVHLRPARTTNPSGETIHTTANHPWLTADRGWVEAGQLQVGEPLVTLNGSTGTVAWVHTVAGQADMYNLTVANDHTYAVGAGQWVVHNIDPNPLTPPYWNNWLLPGVRWEHNATEEFPTLLRAPNWETAVAQASRLAGFQPGPENLQPIEQSDSGRIAEWHGPEGEKISMDWTHPDMVKEAGHDMPHVGWQQEGKRPDLAADPEGRSLFKGNITVQDPNSDMPSCV